MRARHSKPDAVTPARLAEIAAFVAEYEKLRPEDVVSSKVLRKMLEIQPEAAMRLLTFRLDSEANGRSWSKGEEEQEHAPGFWEEKLDAQRGGLRPLKDADGRPHACPSCNGVRWVRQINRSAEVVVRVDRDGTAREWAPGESYLRPCDSCSKNLHQGRGRG